MISPLSMTLGSPSYLVMRHCESAGNAEKFIATPSTDLNEVGCEQAAYAGKLLRPLGLTAIVCSPDVRFVRTAQIIADVIGLAGTDIAALPGLSQRRFGELEGITKKPEIDYYLEEGYGMEPRIALMMRAIETAEYVENLAKTERLLVVTGAVIGAHFLHAAEGHRALEGFEPYVVLKNAEPVIVTP